MLIGFATILAVHFGLDEATAKEVTPWLAGIVCSYIAGQGLADFGKAKSQLNLKAILSQAKAAAEKITEDAAKAPETKPEE